MSLRAMSEGCGLLGLPELPKHGLVEIEDDLCICVWLRVADGIVIQQPRSWLHLHGKIEETAGTDIGAKKIITLV
jgi:hypothetical protein